jgi:hypothetical protein
MIQAHPVDSFDKKLNFWEEFQSYKVHKFFGQFWTLNRKNNLKTSSLFMWVLALCYDRKSAIFTQPQQDKWEVSCEDLLGDSQLMMQLAEDLGSSNLIFPEDCKSIHEVIYEFEVSIDSPIGISLRALEKKVVERTQFITDTKYTTDEYVLKGNKNVLVKGTADQLDKMFTNTDKINGLIQKAMSDLKSSEGTAVGKGGQNQSLGDGNDDF